MKQYLNLGCGHKYVVDSKWLNADMDAASADVQVCNFINGIPFEDNRFDLVYHSHVLEHFNKEDGAFFIAECYRVCKPGGVIRIALPNLEIITKNYLQEMEKAIAGDAVAKNNYDWMLLEMYDQTVRNQSGGDMIHFLTQPNLPNQEYVLNRIGQGGLKFRENYYEQQKVKQSFSSKLKLALQKPGKAFEKITDAFLRIILGQTKFNYYQIGRFRNGGEIHQWMYDRYSLKLLLEKVGFTEVTQRTATASYIHEWKSYHLDDTTENASLFMEGVK